MSGITPIPFAVEDKPFCMWVEAKTNLQFLEGIDPYYFTYLASVHGEALNNEDEKVRQHAALSLRVAYSQGLETLFSFIFAAIQAPYGVVGWLQKYQSSQLRSLIGKVRNRQPVRSRLAVKSPEWKDIVDFIFAIEPSERIDWVKAKYAELWSRFSSDYSKEGFHHEYNSIKHGFRIRPGGFSLAIGAEDTPGIPAKRLTSLGSNEYGSSYYVAEKVDDDKISFQLRHCSRNWSPQQYVVALQLIDMSLNNIISFLKILHGVEPSSVNFYWPTDKDDFDSATTGVLSVSEFSIGPFLLSDKLPMITAAEVLATYENKPVNIGTTETL